MGGLPNYQFNVGQVLSGKGLEVSLLEVSVIDHGGGPRRPGAEPCPIGRAEIVTR